MNNEGRPWVSMLVTGVKYHEGIDECEEEQEYIVTMESAPYDDLHEFGTMQAIVRRKHLARYFVGARVRVRVEPLSEEPLYKDIEAFRRARDACEDNKEKAQEGPLLKEKVAAALQLAGRF